MRLLRLAGTAALAFSLLGAQAQAQERYRRHVRVVLDTSLSMVKLRGGPGNDPGRLAILSTLLLHDLVAPNTSLGDSFVVYPFDKTWQAGSVPSGPNHARIAVGNGGREAFKRQIEALQYDAPWTYFYPGLKTAIDDLKKAGSALQDVRAIVLVTDGLPEKPTRDAEQQRILRDLVPILQQEGVRLYVLAFGPVAGIEKSFFERFVVGPAGTPLGAVLADPDGGTLPRNMVEIFGNSFGYATEGPLVLPGTPHLDLAARGDPEQVAVVLYSPGTPQPPEWELRAPDKGGVITADQRARTFGQAGGSYSLRWLVRPKKGGYVLAAKLTGGRGQAILLRPAWVELKVLPRDPNGRSDVAVAGLPLRLSVLVSLPGGITGDPGEADLLAWPLGPWDSTPGAYPFRGSSRRYTFKPDREFPPDGVSRVEPEGRYYDLSPVWPWPEQVYGRPFYDGRLWIEARRRNTLVAAIVDAGQRATERVQVYPRIVIKPAPEAALAATRQNDKRALKRGEQACADFELVRQAGPIDPRKKYSLRAWLDQPPARTNAAGAELHEAAFTLDGQRLDLEGQPDPKDSDWSRGVSLEGAKLLGKHQVCVTLGKPTQGDAGQPLGLPLRFRLLEVPYNDYADVISPFTLQVLVAPPTYWERWRAWILAGLALLALLAALWYLRDRPDLPADLAYTVTFDGGSPAAARAFESASLVARLLGLVAKRPVRAPGNDDVLAWLRPVDPDLYHLQAERGVEIEADASEKLPRRGRVNVAVQRPYRLKTARGTFVVRLEYV